MNKILSVLWNPGVEFDEEGRRQRRRENVKAAAIIISVLLLVALFAHAGSGSGLVGLGILLAPFFFFWGLPIMIAHNLGHSRQRTGWMWGFFLGWLGVLILACMRSQTPAS